MYTQSDILESFGGSTDRETYNNFILELRNDLKTRSVISRVEYAGSRYKGTVTNRSDYDNMFVKRNTSITATRLGDYPEYYELICPGWIFNGPINRTKVLTTFRSEVEATLRNTGASKFAKIVKAYGPTVVVEYQRPGDVPFEVDLVYALEAGDGEIYIAKAPSGKADNVWYNTKVLKEKDRMRTIDQDNGVGKMVVRYVKTLKEQEPGLTPIASYAFEQVLMDLKDLYTDTMWWRENNLSQISTVFLEYMAGSLRRGALYSYYDRSSNTIGHIPKKRRDELADGFSKLAQNPWLFLQMARGHLSVEDKKHLSGKNCGHIFPCECNAGWCIIM